MTTLTDYTNLQQAILRKQLPAEAQVQFAAQTDLAVYEDQLIQRASTSTEAALLISQIVLGKVPASEQKLTDLTNFAQTQFNAYVAKGVAQPEIGPYEALGRGFSSTPEFAALLAAAGGSDGQFVTNIYVASFGTQPNAGQVQHFIDQINYFKGIYQAAGLSAADASLQAHGAVLGQIVGTAALVQGGLLDTAAEIWLKAEAAGTAKFNAPIGDSNPANAPPVPVDQTIPLTAGLDVIVPTADKPLDGNDTVLGNGQTIQSNDTVDLGAGFDKANLVIEPQTILQFNTVYKLNLANVEQVNVTSGLVNIPLPIQLSANGWTGVQEFWLRDSNLGFNAGVILNDIKSNMALGFDDYQGRATYLYKTGALGAGATVNVVLENVSHVDLRTNTAVAGDDIGTMNLTVLGAGNTLALNLQSANGLDGLNKLFLFGDGGITLHNETELNSLTVLDGSANSGGFDIEIVNSTAALAATGTSAADKLTFTNGFDANDSFNGGAGDDTLEVNVNQAVNATSANVSNVEHLQVFGALTSTQTFTNSAGFSSIELESNNVTNNIGGAHNLRLVNFANVIIDGDSNGLLQIANTGATHITFNNNGDAHILDVAEAGNVEISYSGNNTANIDELVLTRNNGFQTFQTTSLKFDGTGDISINNAITGSIGLVDLSNDSGAFDMNGNVFGLGTDFLIGNLATGSHIDLSNPSSNPLSVNELVFSGKQMGSIEVHHFDATPGGAHDILDVGALGISSLTELNITVTGGNTHIAANAGQFTGEIVVLNVDLLAAPGSAAAYIDFNGHIG